MPDEPQESPESPPDESLDEDDFTVSEQPTVDASSKQSLKKQALARDRDRNERQDFWKGVLAGPIGRREMWQLLHAKAHAFNVDFPVGPVGFPDPNAAWYRRGQQDLGLQLFHDLQVLDPQGVLLMQQEHDVRFITPKIPRRRASAS